MLLDANMPGMDGFTVARAADGARRARTAPTIMMLTSSGEPHDSVRCRDARHLVLSGEAGPADGAVRGDPRDARPHRRRSRSPPRAGAQTRAACRCSILLAEDNVVNQRVAIGMLEKAGHVVTLAENGRIALEKLDAGTFDLVLMDMQMPEMGGAEAIAAIRGREQATGTHIPIISLTAHALKGDRERCLDTGADGYVSKPIAPAALFGEIERVMAGAAIRLRPPPRHPSPVTDTLLARVGGSQEVLQEIIGLFLEDSPEADRGDSDGARGPATPQAVYRAAHTLKGSVGNFDAHAAVALAQRLEARAREGDLAAANSRVRLARTWR